MIELVKKKFNDLISDKKFSEIFTGSIWVLSANAIIVGLQLIINIIVARVYGADSVGILNIITSFLSLAVIFTIFGTDTSILRLIPEHLVRYSTTSAYCLYRKTQYLIIGISLVTGTICFLSSDLIADKVFSKPYLSFYFAITSGFLIFKSIATLNTQAVRGLKFIKTFAMMQILPMSSNLILLLVFSLFSRAKGMPTYAMLFSFAVTGIIGWIIMEGTFKRRILPSDKIHTMSVKDILSISTPMLMTATINFLIGQTGVMMLGMFRSDAEVGYYSIAVKLAHMTNFLLGAINGIAAPKFAELYHSDKMDELFYVAKKSTKLAFWSNIPIILTLVFLGKLILHNIFGKEFIATYSAMEILILGQIVNCTSGATATFMNMTGHQNVLQKILFFAAAINIGLNFALTPRIGINGSAVAAMISICFWNICALVFIKKKFGKTMAYLPLGVFNNWNKKCLI